MGYFLIRPTPKLSGNHSIYDTHVAEGERFSIVLKDRRNRSLVNVEKFDACDQRVEDSFSEGSVPDRDNIASVWVIF